MRTIGERQLHVQRRRDAHHDLEREALGSRAGVGGHGLTEECIPRKSPPPTLLAQEGNEFGGGGNSRWSDVTAKWGQEAHHRAEP